MAYNRYEMLTCADPDCNVILEVITACGCDDSCEIACCGTPLTKQEEKTADATTEKHVPVIEVADGKTVVKVGSVPHPMETEHYIQFIELHIGDMVMRQYLKPGDAPEACFPVEAPADAWAREHCNVHGLWKS